MRPFPNPPARRPYKTPLLDIPPTGFGLRLKMSSTFLMHSFDKGEATPVGNLLRITPVLGGGIGLLSLFLCIIISKATDVDTGGLDLPYISDTGREGAAYFIFAILNTIASVFNMMAYFLNHHRLNVLRLKVKAGTGFNVARWVMLVFGVLSCFGFSVLSVVSTLMSAPTHNYSAYVAVIGLTFYVCINTSLVARARAVADEASREQLVPRKLWLVKSVVTCMAALMFVIYIPVGLSILCEWDQDPVTKLYDYRNCLETHKLRSATQHLFVWCCLFYVITLYHDFEPHNMVMEGGVVVGQPVLTSIEVVGNPVNEENKA
uniref:CWH43-like N-terminal domain-containing protein n=1 Tax=Hemiselmis tepida TaxID=464990 RepID=A0A7S0Z6W1_9CRYP|mmetsp:Transcript_8428/g.21848  ORF Transcript_8428/g.21848 Transcript_8428/m.21848 type:complete len:319 (+) Transcript_8428:290-1246(+)